MGIVVITSIVLAFSGFLLIKKIIDSIIKLNSEVKCITGGELSHQVNVSCDDEIGELSSAMNQLTSHIKDNMDELKIYGERTKNINLKINRQISALTGVLQMGNLISEKSSLKDAFEMAVSRIAQLTDSPASFVLLFEAGKFEVGAYFGLSADSVAAISMSGNDYVFEGLKEIRAAAKIAESDLKTSKGELLKLLQVKSLYVNPLFVRTKIVGFLCVAGRIDGKDYSEEDSELINLFSKQLVIAIENDHLTKKVQDLEVKDNLTGLYNRHYISDRLEEEILRSISNQRPCAFIAVKIKGLKELSENSGEAAVEDILNRTANILKDESSEFDKAGRIEFDEFGLLLPEKNKKYSQALAQEIKTKLEGALSGVSALRKDAVSVAAVENPIDGTDAATLMKKAEEYLEAVSKQ